MSEDQKAYSNGEIVVHWNAQTCTHSGNCVRGLPAVFDVKKRPWITITGASTQEIVDQVAKCPSGALSIEHVKPE